MSPNKSVPIPDLMSKLKLDKRGYPIPYTVLVGNDGTPYFTANNMLRQLDCAQNRKCSICGQLIEGSKWFIGGPGSAFHPYGAYADNAVHGDCKDYAMQVCPYLAVRNYSGRIDAGNIDPNNLPGPALTIDSTIDPNRPKVFVAVECSDYHLNPEKFYLYPKKPYQSVEFWLHGKNLHWKEGLKLVDPSLLEFIGIKELTGWEPAD